MKRCSKARRSMRVRDFQSLRSTHVTCSPLRKKSRIELPATPALSHWTCFSADAHHNTR